MIEVVAAQRRIAAGGQHFEHALRQSQDRDVERAAAQVVYRVDAFGCVIEAVGDGGRGGLVQQAQHVEARELRRVLRRLPLRIVEVRRHRDYGTRKFRGRPAKQLCLGAISQRLQDLRRHFDRTLRTGDRAQLQHPGRVDEIIRRVFDIRNVGNCATHEALHRRDRVARIACEMLLCFDAHRSTAPGVPAVGDLVADHRGQQPTSRFVSKHLRAAIAHHGNQRIGRAEIDADRDPALMRRGRFTGFRNLEESHAGSGPEFTPRWRSASR